jgi:LmbE family N-acetylglucosaminyl deacetylase
MNLNPKKVLVLAPHTDDGELGCGGALSKFKEQGAEIFYAAFSSCEQSVPDHLPKDILKTELKNATAELGISSANVHLFDYQVRMFSYKRQEILEDIVVLRKKINPDLVFIPSFGDVHQDHATIAAEGLRAFKNSSVFSYELIWNQMEFRNQCFVKLEQHHLDAKINALKQYASQGHRSYTGEVFLTSLARVRGVQAGSNFAEMFEVHRLIL